MVAMVTDTMQTGWQIIGGMIGGVAAWFGTMLIGQPFYEFRLLRRRAADIVEKYSPLDQHRGNWTDALWMDRAEDELKDCAAKLSGFAASHPIVCRCLRLIGYFVREAGDAMFETARLAHAPGSEIRRIARQQLARSLKLEPIPDRDGR
jgi:hypothetical protein